MIAFLPNCGFLSEVSRAVAIARALRDQGVPVAFAARGGPYEHLLGEAGFAWTRLEPPMDDARSRGFLDAVLGMGTTDPPFYGDDELAAAVDAEVAFLRAVAARAVVVGFTLTAYLSSRVVGVPLVTDHGGSFVPPVLAQGLCPAPVAPPAPAMGWLPVGVQRWLANTVPAFLAASVADLDRHADRLGVERISGFVGLMCGDLTLVTELPEVLGVPREAVEGWRPRWPWRLRSGTTFRCTGPLYARLDRPLPAEVDAFLSADGPVVYVAPTSVDVGLLRALVARARDTGFRVLVAATVHDLSAMADARTLVAGVLPNHVVMPRVAAAVLMGGQGSVQTAMASGTPFVGLPLHGEQELNVAVAERAGCAIRMSTRDATSAGALATALRRLVEEPSFATAARVAAARYAGVDGAARAASAIRAHLGPEPEGVSPRGAAAGPT